MRTPSEADLLALWEVGSARHPIDRALMLGAWARPELNVASLPELSLGALNKALLRLRNICFGPGINACVECESCSEQLEIALDVRELLASSNETDSPAEFEISGMRFRVPNSRDLAAISDEQDVESAALKLLEQCCMEDSDKSKMNFAGMLAEAEDTMESLDPAADINLALTCESCGHHWSASFDIGALLWDEFDGRARSLLADIHSLARAYGWTEPEILALSPQRRATYLGMVEA